jgi:Protein of unknown function (DUF2934)
MAVRKTTKTQVRQKQNSAPESIPADVSLNGDSTGASSGRNGGSPSFEQIQRRAYELFMARGGTHGSDMDDWFTAEQELIASSAAAH